MEVTYNFKIVNVANREKDYEFSIIEYDNLNNIENEYKLYVDKHENFSYNIRCEVTKDKLWIEHRNGV